MFLDESEALTHPYLARCWARRGTELRIQAPGQAKKRAMLGAFDPVHRHLLVHTSATKRSTDFVALLDQLGAAYGTAERARPLVAVLDNGPIHTSKLTTKALAARPWLTLEWLPKYAPELNDIERCWRDLKQHQLANRTFADADALARAIPDAVARLNHERQPHHRPFAGGLLRSRVTGQEYRRQAAAPATSRLLRLLQVSGDASRSTERAILMRSAPSSQLRPHRLRLSYPTHCPKSWLRVCTQNGFASQELF